MPSPAAPYTPFYPSWQDNAGGGTPIDAAALNHMEAGIEAALPAPAAPASGDLPIWNPAANGGAGGWDTTTNMKIARAALGSLAIKDADIDPAAAISIGKLNGFPNSATKFARGDGVWSSAAQAPYRKTTDKTVVNTTAATDLLNGEITVAANSMGPTGILRLTAWGNLVNTSGVNQSSPRFKLIFGASTMLDSNVIASSWGSGLETAWKLTALIANQGTTNSQEATLDGFVGASIATAAAATPTTGVGIVGGANDDMIKYMVWSNGLTVDTTLAQLLQLQVVLPAANAALGITLGGALVEIL